MEPYRETKSFTLRIELEADFGDDYEGDDDGGEWVRRWLDETRPALVASVIRTLAAGGQYRVVTRSRGRSPEDEVEVVASLRIR